MYAPRTISTLPSWWSLELPSISECLVVFPVDPAQWYSCERLFNSPLLLSNKCSTLFSSRVLHRIMEFGARFESITGNRAVRYITGTLLVWAGLTKPPVSKETRSTDSENNIPPWSLLHSICTGVGGHTQLKQWEVESNITASIAHLLQVNPPSTGCYIPENLLVLRFRIMYFSKLLENTRLLEGLL